MCRIHLDLIEKDEHPNGSTQSLTLPLGTFNAATRRIHNAIVDEFGDGSVTETGDTRISSDESEPPHRHSPLTEGVALDELSGTGRGFSELDTP